MDGGTAVEQASEAVPQVAAKAAQAATQAAQASGITLNFTFIAFLALALLFMVAFIRALPWSAETKAKKPLSCPACLAGWAAIALGAWCIWIGLGVYMSVIHILPAAGAAFLLVSLTDYWRGNLPPA